MKRTLSFVICCMLALLVLAPSLLAACADIGSFPLAQPKVTVEYSKAVKIDSATMTYLGQNQQTFPLCARALTSVTPAPTFNTVYELTAGSCGGAAQPLQAGRYVLTISASDASGTTTQPNPPDCRTFTITGMQIDLVSPATGMGTSNPIAVTLRTHEVVNGTSVNRAATCKWTASNTTLDPASFATQFAT